MNYSIVLILTVLLFQPLLDSFDVADHNSAINQSAKLLDKQQSLNAHCLIEQDHLRHQAEHEQLDKALSDSAQESHCHVCHTPTFFQTPALLPNSKVLVNKIAFITPQFESAPITPEHRPPISFLLS